MFAPCWNDPANWSAGVPGAAATAIIPAVAAGRAPITCNSATCDTVILRASARLNVQSRLSVRVLTLESNAWIDTNDDWPQRRRRT